MPASGHGGVGHQEDACDIRGSNVDAHTPLLKKTVAASNSLLHTIALSFQDWFSWEILSAITATVAVAAIIIILAVYDESSLPDWPSVFTINSVVSLFGTISKMAIMSIIGASISQSKWLWYRQESHALQDIQAFDDASRGPWGAMALISSLKVGTLATLGSSIVVLMLLFDPFLQQTVVYPDRLVRSHEASTIVRAQTYQARSYEGLALASVLDLSMKAAIYSGIFDVQSQASVRTEHYCSTGNCTWQSFSSLAVCSKCVNVTSQIKKSCNDEGCYELSLPGGPKIHGFGGQINASVTDISSDLHSIEASVVQFSSLISKRMNKSDDAVAWECALYYCVNTFTASVTDGEFSQAIHETWRNDSASYSQASDLIYNPPDSIIDIATNSSFFKVANLAAKALNTFTSETFTGSGGIKSPSSGSAFSSDVINALYYASNYSHRMDNLAASMTNNIRKQNDSESSPFEGETYKAESYVHVQWAWLTYPLVLLLASLLCLFGTILDSARRKILVWKSSNLALLFHGQGLDLNDQEGVAMNALSQMGAVAQELKFTLVQKEDENWNLVRV